MGCLQSRAFRQRVRRSCLVCERDRDTPGGGVAATGRHLNRVFARADLRRMVSVGPTGVTSKITPSETRVGEVGCTGTSTVVPAHAPTSEFTSANEQVVMIQLDCVIREFMNPGDVYRAIEE